MYSPPVRGQRRRNILRALLVCIILLTAVGGILFRYSFSLQDIGRISRLAVGRLSPGAVPERVAPEAEEPLRGTIYDRSWRELSVSYQLYSLFVQPAKVHRDGEVLDKLAEITGRERSSFSERINRTSRVVELADDLDRRQALEVERLGVEGVYCTSREQRFYPEHTSAAHVLGYTGNGIGLSGVESRYDAVLRPGVFTHADLPAIDFQDRNALGAEGADLVLTLDAGLQKAIDQRLRELLERDDVGSAMAVLLEPSTGRVLALSSRPSFDPNYFWKASAAERSNRLYDPVLDPALLRPIFLRAAARKRNGEQFAPLLPVTVAAPDYGLEEKRYAAILNELSLLAPVPEELPSDIAPGEKEQAARPGDVSLMQLAVDMASLVNGGWRITPRFLDSVWDVESSQRYPLRKDAVQRNLVLSPAMGVIIRRELLLDSDALHRSDALILAGTSTRVVPEGDLSRYLRQQLFVGLVPRKKPTMLLMLAVEGEPMGPLQKRESFPNLAETGQTLLKHLWAEGREPLVAEHPREKNRDNFARFLISRRVTYIDSSDGICDDLTVMPQLVGMSLRKGLQRLNRHNLQVRVQGSGRIIGQYPAPGVPLRETETCRLTLESEI